MARRVRVTEPNAEQRSTRISCPDCSGVLTVHPGGHHRHLLFICRVGHTYSVMDLLAGKEEQIEGRLWSAIVALEEMVEIAEDFRRQALAQGLTDAARVLHDRAQSARAQVTWLRTAVEDNRAIEIGEDIGRIGSRAVSS